MCCWARAVLVEWTALQSHSVTIATSGVTSPPVAFFCLGFTVTCLFQGAVCHTRFSSMGNLSRQPVITEKNETSRSEGSLNLPPKWDSSHCLEKGQKAHCLVTGEKLLLAFRQTETEISTRFLFSFSQSQQKRASVKVFDRFCI